MWFTILKREVDSLSNNLAHQHLQILLSYARTNSMKNPRTSCWQVVTNTYANSMGSMRVKSRLSFLWKSIEAARNNIPLEGTGAGLANPSVHSDPSISKVAYCRMHNDSSFRVIAKVQIVAALKSNYWFAWFDACCFQKVFLKGCWKYIIHELNKYVWKRQCFCS